LAAHLAENNHVNLPRQGTVQFDLKFGAALAHTINVIAYMFAYTEFEKMIEIDRDRNIIFDVSN
jgi:hypothetical protein